MASKPKQTATGAWQVRRVVGGKQESRNFPTQAEADAQWALWTTEKIEGRPGVAARLGRTPMHQLWDLWLADSELAATTLAQRRQNWRRWVSPAVGRKRVGDLTRRDVKVMLASIYKESGSPWVTEACLACLQALLSYALDSDMIATNPAAGVGLPKAPRRKKQKPLTFDQVVNVWQAMRRIDQMTIEKTPDSPGWAALVILLGIGGLRLSEAAGLKVTDLHFAEDRIQIERAVTTPQGRNTIGPVKTEAGDRDPRLPRPVMDALAEHILRWPPPAEGWVFHAAAGGPLSRSTLRRRWADATEAAGIAGYPLRNLRHSAASIARSLGLDSFAIAEMLGHSSDRITKDFYFSDYPDAEEAYARKLEQMFRR